MTRIVHPENLVTVSGLSVTFHHNGASVPAVSNLDLTMKKGEVTGLVGESGSGKSVTALAIAGLLPVSPSVEIRGQVVLNGRNSAVEPESRQCRLPKVAMIFQDPFDSLNPSFTIGYQIQEALMEVKGLNRSTAWRRALEMLARVKIPSPETVARQYPHQLSGGMCQRVMIAIALAIEPELLIADEPTTALDVTIQAQILMLLQEMHQATGAAILFITHDLGVVARFCHTVAIMQEGEIVEQGATAHIFKSPLHPYTRGLLNSIPWLGRQGRLQPMEPASNQESPGSGCRYYQRCPAKQRICSASRPPFRQQYSGHSVRCHVLRGTGS